MMIDMVSTTFGEYIKTICETKLFSYGQNKFVEELFNVAGYNALTSTYTWSEDVVKNWISGKTENCARIEEILNNRIDADTIVTFFETHTRRDWKTLQRAFHNINNHEEYKKRELRFIVDTETTDMTTFYQSLVNQFALWLFIPEPYNDENNNDSVATTSENGKALSEKSEAKTTSPEPPPEKLSNVTSGKQMFDMFNSTFNSCQIDKFVNCNLRGGFSSDILFQVKLFIEIMENIAKLPNEPTQKISIDIFRYVKTIAAYYAYIDTPYVGMGFASKYDRNLPNKKNEAIEKKTEYYRNQLRQI